jgi:mevalonate kinase
MSDKVSKKLKKEILDEVKELLEDNFESQKDILQEIKELNKNLKVIDSIKNICLDLKEEFTIFQEMVNNISYNTNELNCKLDQNYNNINKIHQESQEAPEVKRKQNLPSFFKFLRLNHPAKIRKYVSQKEEDKICAEFKDQINAKIKSKSNVDNFISNLLYKEIIKKDKKKEELLREDKKKYDDGLLNNILAEESKK